MDNFLFRAISLHLASHLNKSFLFSSTERSLPLEVSPTSYGAIDSGSGSKILLSLLGWERTEWMLIRPQVTDTRKPHKPKIANAHARLPIARQHVEIILPREHHLLESLVIQFYDSYH